MRLLTARLRGLRRRADQTPAHRDRHIDLLRAVAILLVVTGHWMAVAVTYDDRQGLGGGNVLAFAPWTHHLTWLFQVMPIFFLVGGYANAASLCSHLGRGGDWAGWLLDRAVRLIRPAAALLAVVAGGALVAQAAGVGRDAVGLGAWFVTLPLWFLTPYVGAVALTPVLYALHRRWGLAVPLVLLTAVAAGDLLRLGAGVAFLGVSNFATAWLAIHQLGIAWRDGLLPASPRGAALVAAGGLGAAAALTTVGPYPVSMVAVPGEAVTNTSPPTLALMALAVGQTGIAVLLHGRVNRALWQGWRWAAVVAVNTVILTVFLWHMSAALVAALVLYPTGVLPQPAIGSAVWFLLKLPWLAAVVVVLVLLVAGFSRVEFASRLRVPPRPLDPVSRALVVAGMIAVLLGLLLVATSGQDDAGPAGLPTPAYAGFTVGVVLLELVRARAHAVRQE